ncbi:hypothetical protein BDP81DRAFT_95506 [Colletotrichum phormii]|uniref:Uncharacterized protein n=1 Tax=Colletotrichum phormii TaxID=359342 RepID=A0AAJ0EB85_9PEZI|nr:uncharacterized protein BDP81DRAFT_95506 [Colletotrichum phormii]KAK1625336.1 hypothetical protein BDP81DRAFT_95506 [Colletotrichum phormii]
MASSPASEIDVPGMKRWYSSNTQTQENSFDASDMEHQDAIANNSVDSVNDNQTQDNATSAKVGDSVSQSQQEWKCEAGTQV